MKKKVSTYERPPKAKRVERGERTRKSGKTKKRNME